MKDKLEMMA